MTRSKFAFIVRRGSPAANMGVKKEGAEFMKTKRIWIVLLVSITALPRTSSFALDGDP
jgi:hypothetical protein